MKVLAAIANYGNGNRHYVERLIQEYHGMSFDTDVVILSDRHKQFGADVEVKVGLPTRDPWSLPFAHKQLFADRIEDYDLFIYSEDDTLILEHQIQAFVEATAAVPHPRIVGFMRYEQGTAGERYCSTVHSYFRWKPETVERIGGYTLAEFSNAHAAAFILTRRQLRHAIDSGGFLVAPHSEHYDLPCTAATDPYTQCGMRKVVPISHLDSFLLHHMPNKYIGTLGVPLAELRAQIAVLQSGAADGFGQLFPTEKTLNHSRYHKSYYEAVNQELLAHLPRSGAVLSIGCGSGALEAHLLRRGLEVSAIGLDAVIEQSARLRGVATLVGAASEGGQPDLSRAVGGRTFDAVVLNNIVQHVKDPQALLRQATDVLSGSGVIVGTVPNFAKLPRRAERRQLRRLGYTQTLLHPTDRSMIKGWLRSAGYRARVLHSVSPRQRRLSRLSGGLVDDLLANELLFVGTRPQEYSRTLPKRWWGLAADRTCKDAQQTSVV